MNRRQLFAVGGLATVTPAISVAAAANTAVYGKSALFKRITFQSDGLGLDPHEYTALLHDLTAARKMEPDEYSIGGLVAELERKFAQLLGKESALFLPTGTLANHLAVRKLAGNERRVLVQAESHLFNDSGDCAQTLSGLTLIPLATNRGTFEFSEVKRWVERSPAGKVETQVGVISIENPVRRRDHEMFELGELERICAYAREHGIRLHLDGARMFNLPYHSGRSIREYAALFDTVYVSLWKHFNGASGAMLAGDASFIEGLFHTRRMFGGSLPQAWPDIALVAQSADRYLDEYARAWLAADEFIALLHADGRFKAQKLANGTSRFLLAVAGVAPESLIERVSKRGVILPLPRSDTGVFPMQVNATILRTTPAALARIFTESMPG